MKTSILLLCLLLGSTSLVAQRTFYSLEAAMRAPAEVEYLDLSSARVQFWPHNLHKLRNLRWLSLSGSTVADLPDALFRLPRLQHLDLSHLQFQGKERERLPKQQLPKSISKASQLRYLNLSKVNWIRDPLPALAALKQLDSLILDDIVGNLGYWPEQKPAFEPQFEVLAQLTNLRHLVVDVQMVHNFDFNRLGELPKLTSLVLLRPESLLHFDTFLKKTSLRKLALYENQWSDLACLAKAAPHLSHLALYRPFAGYPNRLRDFLKGIPLLPKLKTLLLYANETIELPEELGECPQLEHLEMPWANYPNLDVLAPLQELKYLHLQLAPQRISEQEERVILELPSFLFKFSKLQTLLLNQPSYLPIKRKLRLDRRLAKLQYLKHLDLSGWELQSLPPNFSNLKKLQELHLHGCNLPSSALKTIATLHNLQRLYIGGNQFEELPNSFIQLKKLRQLSISNSYTEGLPVGNSLKAFPAVLCKMPALRSIELLGQYEIDSLPQEWGYLEQHLEVLVLYDCPIQRLPRGFGDLKGLRYLNLNMSCVGYDAEICHFIFSDMALEPLPRLEKLILGNRQLPRPLLDQLRKQGTAISDY